MSVARCRRAPGEGEAISDRPRRLSYEGRAEASSPTSAKPRISATGPATAITKASPPRSMPLADLVKLIADVDFLPASSEVDAPFSWRPASSRTCGRAFNVDLKDDKDVPCSQVIRVREEFPRVEFTRTPAGGGVRLCGPFTSARPRAQAIQVLRWHLPVPHLLAGHPLGRRRWALVRRPCLLHSIRQCTAPVQLPRVTREEYRESRSVNLADGDGGQEDRLLARRWKKKMREGERRAAVREGGPTARRHRGR